MSLDAILRELPQLRHDELDQVAQKARALASLSVQRRPPPTMVGTDDWLLEGIYHELGRRGLLRRGWRMAQAKLGDQAPDYATDAAETRAHLLLKLGGKTRSSERLALGILAARCLADYLAHVAPLCLRVMLRNVGKTVEALDASFPGYLESGMLTYLLREPKRDR
jgi:hypothetical protein